MQSNSVIFWWNLGPRITSRSIFCILNGCKSVTTCGCGQEESVDHCYWMAGVTVGELQGLAVHRDTTVRAGGFYHFELNKDVNKGRVREWKGCSESVLLISILSVAGIRFIIGNISGRLHHTVVLPPVIIFIYAFGKTSLMYLACVQDMQFISQACGLSFTTALPNEL